MVEKVYHRFLHIFLKCVKIEAQHRAKQIVHKEMRYTYDNDLPLS